MTESGSPAKIKVLGVGGAGCNAVNRIIQDGITNVEVYAINTDVQHLNSLSVPNKIQIGEKVTRGRGAGAIPEKGKQAAEEDADRIREIVRDADMVFITAGLGGGTGTGASPVIAGLAKEMGILTVAVVTLPFGFEADSKMSIALKGLEELKNNVDTYIVVHNQKLVDLAQNKAGLKFKEAFKLADSVLSNAVRSITEVLNVDAQINVDFADMKTIMQDGGLALIGMDFRQGDEGFEDLAEKVIRNPLLEGGSIEGARRLLLTLWAGSDVDFMEAASLVEFIKNKAGGSPEVIFGAVQIEDDPNALGITVIATDFENVHIEAGEKKGEFKVIRQEPEVRRAVPDESISPVDPETEPAIIRRRKKRL